MNTLKAKFNVIEILYSEINYGINYEDLVMKYENEILEVKKKASGEYELELDGKTFTISAKELIFL